MYTNILYYCFIYIIYLYCNYNNNNDTIKIQIKLISKLINFYLTNIVSTKEM